MTYLAVLIVLGTVAGAGELVERLAPGYYASQMSAHGVDTEILKGAVFLGDEVCGITL